MERLKESFRLNELQYTLLRRNDFVALYGIGGTFTDKPIHFEVSRIYIRHADKYSKTIRESLPTNEQFGRDLSRSFSDKNEAYEYFDKVTKKLILLQGVPKAVLGVEQKVSEVFWYQAA